MKLLMNFLPFIILILACNMNAQNSVQAKKDTLYFKYDSDYIVQSKNNDSIFYIADNNNDGAFILIKKKEFFNLKNKKIVSLKEYIRSSKFYRKNYKRKLLHSKLANFLRKTHTIFLVKDCKIFIEVTAGTEEI